jgi:hypothetical protein
MFRYFFFTSIFGFLTVVVLVLAARPIEAFAMNEIATIQSVATTSMSSDLYAGALD